MNTKIFHSLKFKHTICIQDNSSQMLGRHFTPLAKCIVLGRITYTSGGQTAAVHAQLTAPLYATSPSLHRTFCLTCNMHFHTIRQANFGHYETIYRNVCWGCPTHLKKRQIDPLQLQHQQPLMQASSKESDESAEASLTISWNIAHAT